MSSPLAIAAVTAVLKDLLNNGLINHDLSTIGSFTVTALPPDRITTGTQEPNQLNLFLYQVTPNLGWRNVNLPSRDSTGERLTNPPLALDLHYLLTAYGAQDFNAEILLGYAMQLLHETPVFAREDIRTALGAPSPVGGELLPSPFGNLSALDLAEQVELIKIAPQFLTTEELSKLWTAMQARYRPTMGYQVSVVLIQSTQSTKAPLPVLQRGKDDRGVQSLLGTSPSLEAVRVPLSGSFKPNENVGLVRTLPSAQLGDELALVGQNLSSGTVSVRFKHPLVNTTFAPENLLNMTDAEIIVKLPAPGDPNDPTSPAATWPAGFYTAQVIVSRSGEPDRISNEMAFSLAPTITLSPTTAPAGNIALTVTCIPPVWPQQRVSLLFRDGEMVAPDRTAKTQTLNFNLNAVPPGLPGEYVVRLRVDGVDSIPVDRTAALPQFAENQKVKVTS